METLSLNNLDVTRYTKGKLPRLPFLSLKEKILGKKYDLSIVFIGRNKSREINKKFLNKNKPANILSFPLSDSSGEIFINLEQVRRDAPCFNKTYMSFLGYLIIHGILHLKGLNHGKKMNNLEKKYSEEFRF